MRLSNQRRGGRHVDLGRSAATPAPQSATTRHATSISVHALRSTLLTATPATRCAPESGLRTATSAHCSLVLREHPIGLGTGDHRLRGELRGWCAGGWAGRDQLGPLSAWPGALRTSWRAGAGTGIPLWFRVRFCVRVRGRIGLIVWGLWFRVGDPKVEVRVGFGVPSSRSQIRRLGSESGSGVRIRIGVSFRDFVPLSQRSEGRGPGGGRGGGTKFVVAGRSLGFQSGSGL